ncbi:hypothetical protein LVJ94_35425 [Pendulispora rubella]|uniref:Carboxypeptidase regulatory-like domain-containing protein n=1 Tax=Pendulispora rubella TaxID=2741070 RepID=A0ABZ2KUF2_9BACT
MSLVAVDFFVSNSTTRTPIQGVIAKIISRDGTLPLTQAETDASGRAAFLLPADHPLQVRFYKVHITFRNPLLFTPKEAGPNVFGVEGHRVADPVPTDPRLCCAYGYFRSATGAPAAHVDIYFTALFKPLVLDGDLVLTERAALRTDGSGYGQINLLRSGTYAVSIQGYQDNTREIYVPDAANVNLPDLLAPVVQSVAFVPEGPFALRTGQDLPVAVKVVASDGRILAGSAPADVRWSSSNEQVFAPLQAGGALTLRGLGKGSAELRAERLNPSQIRVQDSGIQGVPVTVRVS